MKIKRIAVCAIIMTLVVMLIAGFKMGAQIDEALTTELERAGFEQAAETCWTLSETREEGNVKVVTTGWYDTEKNYGIYTVAGNDFNGELGYGVIQFMFDRVDQRMVPLGFETYGALLEFR